MEKRYFDYGNLTEGNGVWIDKPNAAGDLVRYHFSFTYEQFNEWCWANNYSTSSEHLYEFVSDGVNEWVEVDENNQPINGNEILEAL